MPLNKRLLRKVRSRIAKIPESYDQDEFVRTSRKSPCGAAACLAGETVICNASTVKKGIETLRRMISGYGWVSLTSAPPAKRAKKLLGLTESEAYAMFQSEGIGWPEPYASKFSKAVRPKTRAKIAVAYLDECLKRGKVTW